MKLRFHKLLVPFIAMFVAMGFMSPVLGADAKSEPKRTIINNVNVCDGKSDKLAMGMSVLVENNLIKKIGKSPMKVTGKATITTNEYPASRITNQRQQESRPMKFRLHRLFVPFIARYLSVT